MLFNTKTDNGRTGAKMNAEKKLELVEGKSFQQKLLEHMQIKGWNQTQLAKQAGLKGRDAISRYVRGVSKPSRIALTKIAKAFNVPEEYLLPEYDVLETSKNTLSMNTYELDETKVHFKANKVITIDQANRIFQILTESDGPQKKK